MQFGFGWGKGRRVIKTTIAGEALTRALEKHQRWVNRHDDGFFDTWQELQRVRAAETDALRTENRTLKRKLHMAKAELRQETP